MERFTNLLSFPDCKLSMSESELIAYAPDDIGMELIEECYDELAIAAARWKKRAFHIIIPGKKEPLRALAALADITMEETLKERRMNLDYLQLIDFQREKRNEGLIVTLTEMYSNRCLGTNDLLISPRATMQGYLFRGYDYGKAWRLNGEGSDYSDKYYRMISLLESEKFITNFEHTLRRSNGSLCRYWSDVYLFEGEGVTLGGPPLRAFVSHPDAYEAIAQPS